MTLKYIVSARAAVASVERRNIGRRSAVIARCVQERIAVRAVPPPVDDPITGQAIRVDRVERRDEIERMRACRSLHCAQHAVAGYARLFLGGERPHRRGAVHVPTRGTVACLGERREKKKASAANVLNARESAARQLFDRRSEFARATAQSSARMTLLPFVGRVVLVDARCRFDNAEPRAMSKEIFVTESAFYPEVRIEFLVCVTHAVRSKMNRHVARNR